MILPRLLPLVLVTTALACRNKETPSSAPELEPAELKSPTADASPPSAPAEPKEPAKVSPAPPGTPPGSLELIGPPLWITPGKGIGAIFFGAYEDTVTQKMEAPCDLTKSEVVQKEGAPISIKRCAYVDRGLVLTFEDGVLAGIHIHRRDREVRGFELKEPRFYGTFKGGVAPKTVIGLHKHIVEEEYGKPKKDEKLKETGPDGLVALGHYPGVLFEYDALKNGNTVLSGFVVEPDAQAKKVIEAAKEAKREPKGS